MGTLVWYWYGTLVWYLCTKRQKVYVQDQSSACRRPLLISKGISDLQCAVHLSKSWIYLTLTTFVKAEIILIIWKFSIFFRPFKKQDKQTKYLKYVRKERAILLRYIHSWMNSLVPTPTQLRTVRTPHLLQRRKRQSTRYSIYSFILNTHTQLWQIWDCSEPAARRNKNLC